MFTNQISVIQGTQTKSYCIAMPTGNCGKIDNRSLQGRKSGRSLGMSGISIKANGGHGNLYRYF